jgi:prepilin-type N-terminal cleavage/methylation domain-containing protein/prepilin-type processing-associated H-X9-DG protein
MGHSGDRAQHTCSTRAGFTLIELMIVVAIIAVLIGILSPAIHGAIVRARSFKCQMAQRSVAFDFQIFADPQLHGDRGDDGDGATFSIETFQESQYGVDEFWLWGDAGAVDLPDAQGNDPMRCPDVREALTLRNNLACSNGAVGPSASVSFGFNARLHRAETIDSRGRPRAELVSLRSDILNHANVPLLIDVDGQRASELGVNPVYTAPSLDSQAVYANDRVWFPGLRHGGKANIAFMDGHVESSADPENMPGIDWAYQPIR